jgi:hypothetical protein
MKPTATKIIILTDNLKVIKVLADNNDNQIYVIDLNPAGPGFPEGATYLDKVCNFFHYSPQVDADEVNEIIKTLGSYLPEVDVI